MLPDLDDPGTRGHLLEQVRERWGHADIWTTRSDLRTTWMFGRHDGDDVLMYVRGCETEAAALVAALEAKC